MVVTSLPPSPPPPLLLADQYNFSTAKNSVHQTTTEPAIPVRLRIWEFDQISLPLYSFWSTFQCYLLLPSLTLLPLFLPCGVKQTNPKLTNTHTHKLTDSHKKIDSNTFLPVTTYFSSFIHSFFHPFTHTHLLRLFTLFFRSLKIILLYTLAIIMMIIIITPLRCLYFVLWFSV